MLSKRFALLTTLAIISMFVYGCPQPTLNISGEVKKKTEGDSLRIKYDLEGDICRVDSIRFSFINPKTDSSYVSEMLYQDTLSTYFNGRRLRGSFNIYKDSGRTYDDYRIRAFSSYCFMGGTWQKHSFKTPFSSGIGISLGMIGNTKILFPKEYGNFISERGFTFSFNGSFMWKHLNGFLEYGMAGGSGNKPSRLLLTRVDFLPFGRDKIIPGLSIHAGIQEFRIKNDSVSYRKWDYGPGYGAIVDFRYYEITYHYCDYFGGFHKIELLASMSASDRIDLGTRYKVIYGDDIKYFTIELLLKGASGGVSDLNYNYKRNILEKVISSGIIIATIYVIFD